jgi:hypothetical protein
LLGARAKAQSGAAMSCTGPMPQWSGDICGMEFSSASTLPNRKTALANAPELLGQRLRHLGQKNPILGKLWFVAGLSRKGPSGNENELQKNGNPT